MKKILLFVGIKLFSSNFVNAETTDVDMQTETSGVEIEARDLRARLLETRQALEVEHSWEIIPAINKLKGNSSTENNHNLEAKKAILTAAVITAILASSYYAGKYAYKKLQEHKKKKTKKINKLAMLP